MCVLEMDGIKAQRRTQKNTSASPAAATQLGLIERASGYVQMSDDDDVDDRDRGRAAYTLYEQNLLPSCSERV